MKKPFILFDFDGVIADSFWAAFEVIQMFCPHLTEEEYKKRFEGNIFEWQAQEVHHTEHCRTDVDFFSEYAPKIRKDVRIFPGMKEVIFELEKNYSLIVISSTVTSPIQDFLEKHDLANHFIWIMGNDVHKSKVEKMKMVFEKYNIEASDCVFITDTLGDMREAAHVGMGAIGVTWGFHTRDTLLLGGPYSTVESPVELVDSIKKYFQKK